jgi:hypothetical protein
MRRGTAGAVVFLTSVLLAWLPLPVTGAATASVDAVVWQMVEAEGQAGVLLILREQADLGGPQALATKEEKGWYVYQQLTAVAERSQSPLHAYLNRQGVAYRSYWIRNMIRVEGADAALIQELARRLEVDRIEVLQPDELTPLVTTPAASLSQPAAVEWNIQRLQADDVWASTRVSIGIIRPWSTPTGRGSPARPAATTITGTTARRAPPCRSTTLGTARP